MDRSPQGRPPSSDADLLFPENGHHCTDQSVAREEDGEFVRTEKGKGREKEDPNACKALPAEILETILYLTDPDTFASLIFVNRAWRAASQNPRLYAYQLSRCPSFFLKTVAADRELSTGDDLPELKRRFAQEVKRNLFEAYLRPYRTVVNLVSTTTSSSAALPGGEALNFSFSPNGHWVLASSSSRIYVIDTASPKISVRRELKVLRRPISAALLDDGSTLAVLSNKHHISVYDLAHGQPKRLRSIMLDKSTHAIALAPEGHILAAAFDGGVEIHSMTPDSAETEKRTVKCDWAEALSFSHDGTMLLGTARNKNPNTIILTAPYYNEDNQELAAGDQISHIWTSQIIFPNSSRDCSHATLLPNRLDGDATWTFTYDRVFESFRAVRTDDLRNGTTYFTGPKAPDLIGSPGSRHRLTPCTIPAPSNCGDLVAAGFLGNEIWLYGVPESLDVTTMAQTDDAHSVSSSRPCTPSGGPQTPARSYTRGEAAELMKLPKWQVLIDKHRNVFSMGRQISETPGVTGVRWVNSSHVPDSRSLKERLVIAAPGGIIGDPQLEQEGFASVDGGRLVILDFDWTTTDGKKEEMTLEVGLAEPEMLEEEDLDMATEIALARRRTRIENRPAHTAMSRPPLPITDINTRRPSTSQSLPSNFGIDENKGSGAPADTAAENLSLEEASEVFDGPYSHTQPRSRNSLYRSATAVAANRQRNPPRLVEQGSVQYRRPDGRGELPHESDADNWVPPPPPYAPEAEIPLPDHLRRSVMPRKNEPKQRPQTARDQLRRANTMYESSSSFRRNSLPSPTSPSHVHNTRSVSDNFDQVPRPVSPLSSDSDTTPSGDKSKLPSNARSKSTSASNRRPASAYFSRFKSQVAARPSSSYSTSNRSGRTLSQPSVPLLKRASTSRLWSRGADSGPRSESPPPMPTTSVLHFQSDPEYSLVPSMPSAEQLSILNNRCRQAPPAQSPHRMPPGLYNPSPGARIPAPPRGALGAAGSQNSGNVHSPMRSVSNQTSLTRSSPSLLRPAARRLDTIESVSSFVSRARTRSRSRGMQGSESISAGTGQSVGPALPVDPAPVKKSWLGGKRGRGRSKGEDAALGTDKGGKCIMM